MAGFMYNLGVNFNGRNNVSSVLKKINADTKSVAKSTFLLGQRMTAVSRSLPRFGGGLLSYIGPTAALYGAARALRSMIDEATRFEVANVQFEKLIGNADLATEKLLELRTFAAQTPFEFKSSQEISKQLLAAGVTANELIPTLKVLGDLGMGVPDSVNNLTHAYTKIFTTGKAQWRELRMFSTAGVPLIRELQKQLGLSQQQLESFVRRGKVGLPEVQKAMKSMAGAGGQFNGMMYEMMGTSTGLWSNFKDNVDIVSQTLGSVFLPAMKQVTLALTIVAQNVAAWIDENKELIAQGVGKWADELAQKLINLDIPRVIRHFQEWAKAAVNVAKVLIGYSLLVPILNSLSMAIFTIGAAAVSAGKNIFIAGLTALGVWGLVIAALILVSVLIYKIGKKFFNWQLFPQVPDIDTQTGVSELFRQANPGVAEPGSLQNGNALKEYQTLLNQVGSGGVSTTQNTVQTANVNLNLANGLVPDIQGSLPPGITFRGMDFGNQLRGAYA